MFDPDFIKSSLAAILGSVTAIMLFARFMRPAQTLASGAALIAKHRAAGRFTDALDVAKEVAATHPQNLRARLMLVEALSEAGQHTRARVEIDLLATERPGNRSVIDLRSKMPR